MQNDEKVWQILQNAAETRNFDLARRVVKAYEQIFRAERDLDLLYDDSHAEWADKCGPYPVKRG